MAAVTTEFTEEQLNYYRICYVVTDIVTEGLRSIFKHAPRMGQSLQDNIRRMER